MSNKYSFLTLGIACLFSLTALLLISPTAQAQSDDSQNPPTPSPAISSAQIDAATESLDATPLDAAMTNCDKEIIDPQNAAFEEQLIALVNEARSAENLPPLKSSDELNNAARYHARDMAEDEYFEHHTYDRVNGDLVLACEWNTRIKLYYDDYMRLGENIARGYPTPESVFQGWMGSEGHRGNILNENYREIGMGYHDTYWSQVFGEREDVYPVVINDDLPETESQNINVYAYGEWDQVRLRNDDGAWSEWRPFAHNLDWTLPAVVGSRTVEAEMRRGDGAYSSSDSINFVGDAEDDTPPAPHAVNATVFLPVVTR